jgi:hypothetical protein
MKPLGNRGRIGRSISREVSVFFARASFPLEEPAGDTSRGVGLFLVVDGQGKETGVGVRFLASYRRHEDHGVGHGNEYRTVRLTGDSARLDRHGVVAVFECLLDWIHDGYLNG